MTQTQRRLLFVGLLIGIAIAAFFYLNVAIILAPR